MDNKTKVILKRLVRDKTFLACSVVALLGMVCLVGFIWYESNTREADQRTAKQNTYEIRLYICSQIETLKQSERDSLQEEIRASKQFLKDHPNGTQDFSAELIQQGIDRKERKLATLSPLAVGCKQFAETGTITPDG